MRIEEKKANDRVLLKKMAAELEKAESLEDVSDTLAETLFGREELEAISLQIRERKAREEASLATLEPAEAVGAANTADQPATPNPAVMQTSEQPAVTMPIESQINTSTTATMKTLGAPSKPPSNGDDTKQVRAGFLGRLNEKFKG
jgi:hypothetical protein